MHLDSVIPPSTAVSIQEAAAVRLCQIECRGDLPRHSRSLNVFFLNAF